MFVMKNEFLAMPVHWQCISFMSLPFAPSFVFKNTQQTIQGKRLAYSLMRQDKVFCNDDDSKFTEWTVVWELCKLIKPWFLDCLLNHLLRSLSWPSMSQLLLSALWLLRDSLLAPQVMNSWRIGSGLGILFYLHLICILGQLSEGEFRDLLDSYSAFCVRLMTVRKKLS